MRPIFVPFVILVLSACGQSMQHPSANVQTAVGMRYLYQASLENLERSGADDPETRMRIALERDILQDCDDIIAGKRPSWDGFRALRDQYAQDLAAARQAGTDAQEIDRLERNLALYEAMIRGEEVETGTSGVSESAGAAVSSPNGMD